MSGPNLTPGDPLGGGTPHRPPAASPAPAPPTAPAPERERASGYTGPRPPGALGGTERLGPPPPSAAPAASSGPRLELAGWWRRVGAQVIDFVIIGLFALIFLVPLGIGVFGADSDGGVIATIVGFILAGLVYLVVALIYAPLMMTRTNGRTVGRMATGIRVVRTSGQPMDFSTAALREVVFKGLLIGTIANSFTFGIASLLDVLWPLWDEENRALHDFPVQTRTVLS